MAHRSHISARLAILAFLLLLALAPLRADIGFWLDAPTSRSNPRDPQSSHKPYKLAATATPTQATTAGPSSTPTCSPAASAAATSTETQTAAASPVPSATPSMTCSPTPSPSSTPLSAVFTHPGAWSIAAELDYVKAQIAAGSQPWAGQLTRLESSSQGSQAPSYGSLSNSNGILYACTGDANLGQADSEAAYAQALAWYFTGNATYANRSIAILNAWAGLQSIQGCTSATQQNMLDAGWFGTDFANAAEIMRAYPGWPAASIAAFQAMLKRAFYPSLNTMSTWNGNVDLTQIDGMMCMAVFNDDQAEFNAGLARLATRMKAYFYWPTYTSYSSIPAISGDGGNIPSFWYSPASWITGLEQETCRDYGHHVQFGLNSAIHAAEVAWHQGTDVYTTYQPALVPALELLSLQLSSGSLQGACSATNASETYNGDINDTFEMAYNHYAGRKGLSLPNTQTLIMSYIRPNMSWQAMLNLCYETLTHAGVD